MRALLPLLLIGACDGGPEGVVGTTAASELARPSRGHPTNAQPASPPRPPSQRSVPGNGVLGDDAPLSAAPPERAQASTWRSGARAHPYAPASATPGAAKALIVAASAGWENYRHQADALARYQRLKASGLRDADIVMIGADDIAEDPANPAPGVVRNTPGGPNLYQDVLYDYGLEVGPAQLDQILLGQPSADTPEVLELDSGTNLYVYVVGHGGLFGVGMGAEGPDEGVSATAPLEFWEPQMLVETLCTLRAAGGVRRIFLEVETCHGGVYGAPDFWGLEYGCDGGATPLTGALALTAASTLENSIGAGWDPELQQWVGDEFSRAMLDGIDLGSSTWADLYREVTLTVSGSHVSLYNAAWFGELSESGPEEFLRAPAP